MAPPGKNIQVYEIRSKRQTWAPHSVDGRYVVHAPNHYRCCLHHKNTKRAYCAHRGVLPTQLYNPQRHQRRRGCNCRCWYCPSTHDIITNSPIFTSKRRAHGSTQDTCRNICASKTICTSEVSASTKSQKTEEAMCEYYLQQEAKTQMRVPAISEGASPVISLTVCTRIQSTLKPIPKLQTTISDAFNKLPMASLEIILQRERLCAVTAAPPRVPTELTKKTCSHPRPTTNASNRSFIPCPRRKHGDSNHPHFF